MHVTLHLPIQTTKNSIVFSTCACVPHFEKCSATHAYKDRSEISLKSQISFDNGWP